MMRKPLLENCEQLRISDVKEAIPSLAISATLECDGQDVAVIGRMTNLRNGYRYCFLCPECGKAVESLYVADLGSWRCRLCIGAVYASTRKIRVESGQHEYDRSRYRAGTC